MIYINLTVILLYTMLAIMSRKHFSKYKKNGFLSFAVSLFCAMGYTVYRLVYQYIPAERTRGRMRKVQVVSKDVLTAYAEDYSVKNAAVGLAIFFVCTLASVACTVADESRARQSSNIIEREDYRGTAKKQDICLTVDGIGSVYEMEIFPREYTEQEFMQEAALVNEWICTVMLNGNEDMTDIRHDLELPEQDEQGRFTIDWHSENPDCMTSFGKADWDLLTEDTEVVMTASIRYSDYIAVYAYPLLLRPTRDDTENAKLQAVREQLKRQEYENRNCLEWELPTEINGVSISVLHKKKHTEILVSVLGIFISAAAIICRRSRLDEAVRKRDKELDAQYPAFVNRLCMLLQTGLPLRGCMEQAAREMTGMSTLKQELLYMTRELKNGTGETQVYDAFGVRIGLPSYMRLMNQLNQNLRMGTRNVVSMLEEEVGNSLILQRETIKKRGEEVSAKLLFPMVVLLLVVMVIIIFPALQNF